MCGICGQYNFRGGPPVLEEDINRMTRTMVHRGPDDEGNYLAGAVGLGFRRLSIIDLSGGHQPMSDGDGTVWVVFNGEIYNFPELRRELEGYGHIFRTNSDTEVIIHGYKQWGTEVFNHLNGMYGLAIWDELNHRLILARDPMGIKVLYYRVDQEKVLFGSEIRPILAFEGSNPGVDPVALNLFLRYRYTPSPLTLYRGICKLAPGTMLIFENGANRLIRWYKKEPEPFSHMPSVRQAEKDLLELYRSSVRRHLLADVPVGLLLSGGVDSGLLLGLMNSEGESWPSFTVGYGESYRDDELEDAEQTAAHFSSPHTNILINRNTFENALPKIISSLEEPVASSSVVPMYFVCQRARRDVKVALMGQGPDELFGGYRRHVGVRYGDYWRNLPIALRTPIETAISRLPRNDSLKRGVYSLTVPNRMRRYQHVFSIVPGDVIDSLFRDGLIPCDAGDTILQCWSGLEGVVEKAQELGGLQYLELRSSLPDELLMYADKLSMAHGLEVRVPYLDREIVEYVQRLGDDFKVRYGLGKWLHKRVCKKYLPREIIKRKKRGFGVNVVDDWFKSSMGGKFEDFLKDPSSKMYDFFKQEVVMEMLEDHSLGKRDCHKILFSLVVFEEWLRAV